MKSYSAIIALIAAGIISSPAQSTEELDQLKSAMQTMQKNMEDMQKKINELEAEKGAATAPGTNAPGGITFAPPSEPLTPHSSAIPDRGNLNDQQEAAQRLNDLTLDPKYYGFFPIPNTPALIKLNAKPRVDMMEDNQNSGNPDRFRHGDHPDQRHTRGRWRGTVQHDRQGFSIEHGRAGAEHSGRLPLLLQQRLLRERHRHGISPQTIVRAVL